MSALIKSQPKDLTDHLLKITDKLDIAIASFQAISLYLYIYTSGCRDKIKNYLRNLAIFERLIYTLYYGLSICMPNKAQSAILLEVTFPIHFIRYESFTKDIVPYNFFT